MKKLTYQSEQAVRVNVRRFWALYIFVSCAAIGGLGTLLYNGVDMATGYVSDYMVAYMLGFPVSIIAAFSGLGIVGGAYSSRIAKGWRCSVIATWMEAYPEIQAHVDEINCHRHITNYDHLRMQGWVQRQEALKWAQSESMACKRVHGIA